MLYAIVSFYSDRSGARVLGLFDNLADVEKVLTVAAALNGGYEELTVVQGLPGQMIDQEQGNCFKVRAPAV